MQLRWKVACGFFAAVLATAFVIHPPLTSQDFAAWVQAFGSIGAIVGAYVIGAKQSAAQRQLAADQLNEVTARRVAAVKVLFDDVYVQCESMQHLFGEIGTRVGTIGFIISYRKERFDLALQRCESVPLVEFESANLVKHALGFIECARELQELLEKGITIAKQSADPTCVPFDDFKHPAVATMGRLQTHYDMLEIGAEGRWTNN